MTGQQATFSNLSCYFFFQLNPNNINHRVKEIIGEWVGRWIELIWLDFQCIMHWTQSTLCIIPQSTVYEWNKVSFYLSFFPSIASSCFPFVLLWLHMRSCPGRSKSLIVIRLLQTLRNNECSSVRQLNTVFWILWEPLTVSHVMHKICFFNHVIRGIIKNIVSGLFSAYFFRKEIKMIS